MNKLKGVFHVSKLWVCAGLLATAGTTAQAAPLNLNLLTPDITVNYINTNYDAVTDLFTTTYSIPSTLSMDGSTQNTIAGGTMTFTAEIATGGILNSGSFSIGGTVASLGFNSGTLLTGDLIDFGFLNSSQTLEFLFNPTGGDLASSYTFGSGQGGIILAISGYNGDDFNSSFSTSAYNGIADVAPVPVPAAAWLFGSGLLGLVGIARRKA